QTIQRVGKQEKLQTKGTKTERSRRTVPLTAAQTDMLHQHKASQRKEAFKAGKSWHKTNFVFTSTTGTAIEPRNFYRQYQDLLKSARLPHFTFHDLRHSYASCSLRRGVTLTAISRILGHARISTTADIYSHLGTDDLRAAIELVDTAAKR